MHKIRVQEDRFVDDLGRHVILSGINLVHKGDRKNGTMNYIAPWTEKDFQNFKKWGFNVIRLGLIWDAVEPEPGIYNEAYLDWIETMLDLCEKYKIYAFLDMHQDLYSVLYSDGAPKWATITDGEPHVPTDLWSDAYLFSRAVQRAFDNFWANSSAPDGKGLQDHYMDMWVHVAKRFSNHPALIGYDFMNEPYPGSAGPQIFGMLLEHFAKGIAAKTGASLSQEEMISVFSDPNEKFKALQFLEDKEFYVSLAKAVEPLVAEFDNEVLDAFYRKITAAVREVDKNGIIMRENSYFSNMGVECMAAPILDESGKREPNQAFSPHGYDLVVDTEAIVLASDKRVDVIFEAHRRTQKRLKVPVLVGEWGAHGHYSEGLSHIEHLLSLFEDFLWSNTYWCYGTGFEGAPVLNVLKRPYPQAVCGRLLSYRYDRNGNAFHMKWDEKGCSAPTVIYLPTNQFKVEFDGEYHEEIYGDHAFLSLLPAGGERTLIIHMQNC